MSEEATVQRITPQSGLDMSMMLTDTMWGHPQISTQLNEKVRQRMKKSLGEEESQKVAAWELMSFYSRDLRLANLSALYGELQYCQHYIDLAGDLLRDGYMEAFAAALSKAATLLELSQSKGGFLRRRQNTLTQESLSGDIEPKKKALLFRGRER